MNTRYRRLAMTVMVYAALVGGSLLLNVMPGKADSDDDDDRESRIQQGFALVQGLPLHLKGKNRALVGLGRLPGERRGRLQRLPYQPALPRWRRPDTWSAEEDQCRRHYLAGGVEFIPAHPGFHAIVSRNLTPDKTGLPEGGASFQEFRSIMRTGVDPDHAHPEYGTFLVVMPWPVYQGMIESRPSRRYEFLSAIPCIEGDPGLPNPRPIGTRCH